MSFRQSIQPGLEVELAAELNFARIMHRSDLSNIGGVDAGLDCIEAVVVKCVEELAAKLQLDALTNSYVFDRGKIPELFTGPKKCPVSGDSKMANGIGKGINGKPLPLRLGQLNGSDLIGARLNVARIHIEAAGIGSGSAREG